MKDFVFTSVAFGQAYIEQQDRLRASILAIYPDANIMFWRDELPPGSRTMDESLYGFKVHAINEAKMRYSRVLWLDPAMILCDKIDELFSFEMIAIKDDNLLCNYISDQACALYRTNKDELRQSKSYLVGGSLYYFDFNTFLGYLVFKDWFNMENLGLFGSQQQAASEQINSHRNDESCMAISLYISGGSPIDADKIRYCIENNPMFIKKHFK